MAGLDYVYLGDRVGHRHGVVHLGERLMASEFLQYVAFILTIAMVSVILMFVG